MPIIAFTGHPDSPLGRAATVTLDTGVEREVCPFNLAPTSSTTAQIAMGDALAIVVMNRRRFTSEDYAQLHPRGALGRRLLLTVGDVMRTEEAVGDRAAGFAAEGCALRRLPPPTPGAAIVADDRGQLLGLICDGDLRRALVMDGEALQQTVRGAYESRPRTITPEHLAAETLQLMQGPPKISEIPVLDARGKILGMLNLKDLLRAGIL